MFLEKANQIIYEKSEKSACEIHLSLSLNLIRLMFKTMKFEFHDDPIGCIFLGILKRFLDGKWLWMNIIPWFKKQSIWCAKRQDQQDFATFRISNKQIKVSIIKIFYLIPAIIKRIYSFVFRAK